MAMDEQGLENAAILLMSLGEEHASEVFKHLAPKEVQRLGERASLVLLDDADLRARVGAAGRQRVRPSRA